MVHAIKENLTIFDYRDRGHSADCGLREQWFSPWTPISNSLFQIPNSRPLLDPSSGVLPSPIFLADPLHD